MGIHDRLGVGLIGAGPVTQAIHLPALARLGDRYAVRHIMDVDPILAEAVASAAGARWSTQLEAVLSDPDVQVVAICSPHRFHAEQVLAAIAAGMRGILCEKPLAYSADDADALAATIVDGGVPVIVGTMHAYDPAWLAAMSEWGDELAAHTVRSSILLPPNSRFESLATELRAAPARGGRSDLRDPAQRSRTFRDGILTLAIHDLPLVRRFAPTIESVGEGEVLAPFGYAVGLEGDGRHTELFGHVHTHWEPLWTLEVVASDASLRVAFPPSYVHSGSATATLTIPGGAHQLGPYPGNGYVGEWTRLAELVRDGQHSDERRALIDDARYALRIADAVVAPAEAQA